MLGPANDVGRGLETSTALGQNHPRVPTGSIFFQHPEQCHVVAPALVLLKPGQTGSTVRGDMRAGAHSQRHGLAKQAYTKARADLVSVLSLAKGCAPNGNVAAGVLRESNRMAR